MEKAKFLLAQDNASDALAQLARILRQHAADMVVPVRIVSALSQRSFCLPIAPLRPTGEIAAVCFSPDGAEPLFRRR